MGPGAGKSVAEMILHGQSELDVFGYNILRYASKNNSDAQWVTERSHGELLTSTSTT